MKKIKIVLGSGTIAAMLTPLVALALTPLLFGGAVIDSGSVKLVSDGTDPFSAVVFNMPDGMTLPDLGSLSTDFNVTDDDCYGGSPRFQLRIDNDNDGVISAGDKNIFVYLGPHPSFSGCTPNTWTSSGELIGIAQTRYDTSQLGGTFYDTHANALVLAGSKELLRVSIVVDSNWGFLDGEQTILVDNLNIDGEVFDFNPPTDKNQCKNGGWQSFLSPVFKNQGDCVSFVASEGKANGNP